jgi:hypothetical protein
VDQLALYKSITKQTIAFFGPRLKGRGDRQEILEELIQEAFVYALEGRNFKNASQQVFRFLEHTRGRGGRFKAERLYDEAFPTTDALVVEKTKLHLLTPEEKDVAGLLISGSGKAGRQVNTIEGTAHWLNKSEEEVKEIITRLDLDEIIEAKRRVKPYNFRRKCRETPSTRWVRRMRKMGLCTCGSVPQDGFALCKDCRNKAKIRTRDKRAANLKEGLCRCGGKLVDEFKNCAKCRENMSNVHKNVRAQMKSEGRCECGNLLTNGKANCPSCHRRLLKASKEYKRKRRDAKKKNKVAEDKKRQQAEKKKREA